MKDLKKILLAAVLIIAGTTVARADVISDPSQLSNTKVYTINTVRGYLTLDLDETKIVSTMMRDPEADVETFIENENALQDEESRQFGILLIDGRYYLYNLKLKMFAILHNQTLEFYPTMGTGLAFTTDGQSQGPLRIKMPRWGDNGGSDKYFFLNNNGGGSLVLNQYTSVDPGNSLMIEEVEGATLDLDEAMEVFNTPNPWFDSHHVYNIATTRTAELGVATDGINIVGTNDAANSNPACSDDDRKWAFYRDGAKTYLYNVGMQMFVNKDGKLTNSKDDFANFDFILSNNDNYPFVLYMVDNGKWVNCQSTGSIAFNTWKSSFDDGNRQSITEVPGEDAYDDMQAFFEIPSWDITYRLMFEGQEIATVVRNMTQGFDAQLPDNMRYSSCDYEYNPTVITSDADVTVDVFWKGPFEFSSSYSSATWYNLLFDRDNDGAADASGRYYAWYEEGREPYYPKLDADEALRSAPQSQWAFVGNPYAVKIYNKSAGEGMTLWNSGFDNGGNSAGNVVLRDGDHFWSIRNFEEDTNEFSLGLEVNGGYQYINQHGGPKPDSYFGLWGSYDAGSRLMVEDAPDIEVTDVYYDVYYNDAVVASAKVIGQEIGAPITEMPSSLLRDYVEFEYDEDQDVTADLHVQITATWDGPFELAKDFGSAHWYDMSVRSNWYVTSELTDEEGALKTVQANALGLAEDSYQWAFVGDPWNVKIYNKAMGSSVAYAWTVAENKHIPTFVDASSANVWTIRQCTNDDPAYANAFLITIPNLGWQVNQFGGAGGTLKVWNSTGTSDIGSSFAVFDVPDDYAEFVADDIAPIMEIETKWFNWTDEARAAIGYKPEYKESCTLEQYKSMRNAIEALKGDINSFLLPPSGYYRMKNKYHDDYVGMIDDLCRGNIVGTDATTVVKFTQVGEGEYTMQVQTEYLQPLERSTTMYTDPSNPVTFTVCVPEPGYGAFTGTPKPEDETDTEAVQAYDYSFLHRRNDSSGNDDYVGWEKNAPASQWLVYDADDITVTTDDTNMTTLYVPFAVQSPVGVSAFAGKIAGDHLEMTGIKGSVPALTPVVIQANEGTYKLPIVNATAPAVEGNDLKGVLIKGKPSYALTLQKVDGEMAFYTFEGDAIEPNQAYLRLEDTSIELFPMHFGDNTGINAVDSDEQHTLYDLSGRRVNKASKGVYIIDNKKVVLK